MLHDTEFSKKMVFSSLANNHQKRVEIMAQIRETRFIKRKPFLCYYTEYTIYPYIERSIKYQIF